MGHLDTTAYEAEAILVESVYDLMRADWQRRSPEEVGRAVGISAEVARGVLNRLVRESWGGVRFHRINVTFGNAPLYEYWAESTR